MSAKIHDLNYYRHLKQTVKALEQAANCLSQCEVNLASHIHFAPVFALYQQAKDTQAWLKSNADTHKTELKKKGEIE